MSKAAIYDTRGVRILTCNVMDTLESQMRGLQHSDGLPSDSGLLFPTRGGAGYHMRNVPFPIDICFASQDGDILAIDTIKPEIGKSYAPANARWAIEANSGFFKDMGHGIGSKLFIKVEE